MIDAIEPYHPELALLGVAIGASAVAVSWAAGGRAKADLGLDVAPVAGAAALASLGQIPWTVVAAAALATTARHLRSPTRAGRGAASFGSAVLVAGALVGTFLGGPDTEGAVLLGAALPLAIAGVAALGRGGHRSDLWPSLVVAGWVAVDAYRGRPAGLPAALAAIAALVAAATLAPIGRRALGRLAALAGVAAVPSVAARTIGLARSSDAGDWLVGVGFAGVVLAGAWAVERAGRPGRGVSALGADEPPAGRAPARRPQG